MCHVFHADSPFGPFTPHRRNPVKSDVRSARPAGKLFTWNGDQSLINTIVANNADGNDIEGDAEEEGQGVGPRQVVEIAAHPAAQTHGAGAEEDEFDDEAA